MDGVNVSQGMVPQEPSQHQKMLWLRRNQRQNRHNSSTSIGSRVDAMNMGVPQKENPDGIITPNEQELKKALIAEGAEAKAKQDALLRNAMGLSEVPEDSQYSA